ncbi:hypothetical protein JCM3775_006470 [Rhodotorula graminis]
MPPRARSARATSTATAPSTPATPDPRVPTPFAPLSLPGSASLPLGASNQPGYCLSNPLFFLSDAWIPPLRADVDALLGAFAEGYPAAPRYSPCEVMRRLWEGMGWKWVHLLGVPQNGTMRGPWGDSVVRAFLDHLNPTVAPLRQAAAFLALHLFVLTQPASMQRIFLKVDPAMFEYLLALPEQLAPILDSPLRAMSVTDLDPALNDAAPIASLSPPASHDLSTALHALLTSSSFHLVAPETFLHPPPSALPLVRTVPNPRWLRMRAQRALAILGAADEARELPLGRVRREVLVSQRRTRKRGRPTDGADFGDDDDDDDDEEEEEEEEDEDDEGGSGEGESGEGGSGASDEERKDEEEEHPVMVKEWDVDALARLGASYRSAKRFRVDGPGNERSSLLDPAFALQADVLREAQRRTRDALRDVAARGLLGEEVEDAEDGDGSLLRLLDGEGGASGGEGEEGEGETAGGAALRDFADSLRGLLDVRDRMREAV